MTMRLFEWSVYALLFSALFFFKWTALLLLAVVVTALTLE